ncbi:hypothetical protein POM88_034114 [Heracleum sosnowskyi]|uniref:Uncharacterized protein n=1 Tax=Heracleum sosnowskyi TaxID=360622 RepID=A0AAD8HKS9_9APIA|nr:hypothetical protein POM88_034114 [Heracleum sosnowskyi]
MVKKYTLGILGCASKGMVQIYGSMVTKGVQLKPNNHLNGSLYNRIVDSFGDVELCIHERFLIPVLFSRYGSKVAELMVEGLCRPDYTCFLSREFGCEIFRSHNNTPVPYDFASALFDVYRLETEHSQLRLLSHDVSVVDYTQNKHNSTREEGIYTKRSYKILASNK